MRFANLNRRFTKPENKFFSAKAATFRNISDGIGSLFTMIKGAFGKERLLQILRDFIFYPDDDSKAVAIVCRYPQFFAARKMFDNLKAHLRPLGDGKGGTYFGATGCGKTYTMLFLARLIIQRDNETFRNPTIIILTDREDLDTQTSELFVTAKKFLYEQDVRSIESRADLPLKNRPSGGVYVITIQKFCEELGELSARENIICFSDEAHRTQTNIAAKLKATDAGIFTTYGFAHHLRKSFPKATYCGFTGTPIDATAEVFGAVVDSYTMKESCADGTQCALLTSRDLPASLSLMNRHGRFRNPCRRHCRALRKTLRREAENYSESYDCLRVQENCAESSAGDIGQRDGR